MDDDKDCDCEANRFYQKYKDKIEDLLLSSSSSIASDSKHYSTVEIIEEGKTFSTQHIRHPIQPAKLDSSSSFIDLSRKRYNHITVEKGKGPFSRPTSEQCLDALAQTQGEEAEKAPGKDASGEEKEKDRDEETISMKSGPETSKSTPSTQKDSTDPTKKSTSDSKKTKTTPTTQDTESVCSCFEKTNSMILREHGLNPNDARYFGQVQDRIDHLLKEGQGEDEESEMGYKQFKRKTEGSLGSGGAEEQSLAGEMGGVDVGAMEEWTSEAHRRAMAYLKKHKVQEVFQFLGSHLLANVPDNPVDFLINLLHKCIQYRDGLIEPPLLFCQKHVESLFTSMDPMRTNYISYEQYKTGMFTLGIRYYNKSPSITEELIHKDDFVREALLSMTTTLDDLIAPVVTPEPSYYPSRRTSASYLEG